MKPSSFAPPSLALALALGAAPAAAQPAPPAAPPVVAPTVPAAAPVVAPTAAAPVAAPPSVRWYEKFQLEAFVDAYLGLNTNFPTAKEGANVFRVYDVSNGASLHWVGLNVTYPPSPVGGTVSLRLGPGAKLAAGSDADLGLANVKQAFASWKPGGESGTLTIDFGKFDQPFGSEFAETQYNPNYTRSLLYGYAQPFFFTGFRVSYAPVKAFEVKLFAVNGWNDTLDNNAGKSGAVQFILKPHDAFTAYLGYMLGPEQADLERVTCAAGTAFDPKSGTCVAAPSSAGGTTDVAHGEVNKRLRHLVDVVLDANPTKELRLLFNANYGHDQVASGATTKGVDWYGANLALRYAFTERFALAGRGEVYWDPQGYSTGTGKFTRVVDGTLTVAVSPTPNFLVKLEGRVDGANEAFFTRGATDKAKVQGTMTLGVVATTN